MKRDLWSSKQGGQGAGIPSAQIPASLDPQAVLNAQSAIEHYSAMNEGELMSELKNLRQAGGMDDRALQEMTQAVSPMLSEEQRQRLDALIRRLRG